MKEFICKKLIPSVSSINVCNAVYGLNMFQTIKDADVCLNIHADSSSIYASNLRMFEVTGIGSCLLTDWKERVSDLFDPDKEIVTYKTKEECVEKIRWLLDNPYERERIALQGKNKTLSDHTFPVRAMQIDSYIKKII